MISPIGANLLQRKNFTESKHGGSTTMLHEIDGFIFKYACVISAKALWIRQIFPENQWSGVACQTAATRCKKWSMVALS
jgi:hypothetical protein